MCRQQLKFWFVQKETISKMITKVHNTALMIISDSECFKLLTEATPYIMINYLISGFINLPVDIIIMRWFILDCIAHVLAALLIYVVGCVIFKDWQKYMISA